MNSLVTIEPSFILSSIYDELVKQQKYTTSELTRNRVDCEGTSLFKVGQVSLFTVFCLTPGPTNDLKRTKVLLVKGRIDAPLFLKIAHQIQELFSEEDIEIVLQ